MPRPPEARLGRQGATRRRAQRDAARSRAARPEGKRALAGPRTAGAAAACHRHPGTSLGSIRCSRIGRPSPRRTRRARHHVTRYAAARHAARSPVRPAPARAANGRRRWQPLERRSVLRRSVPRRRVPCALACPGTVLRRRPVCPGRDRDPGLRPDRLGVPHRAGVRADLPAPDRRRAAAVRPGRPVPAPAHHDRLRPDPGGPGRVHGDTRDPVRCARASCSSCTVLLGAAVLVGALGDAARRTAG